MITKKMEATVAEVEKAIALLNDQQIIAIPTETVYGLAGSIYSDKAIKQIFELKKRPQYNPLIVHIHSANQLNTLVRAVPEKAKILAKKFWPGPLTLILDKQPQISDLITGGKDTVAVRIPDHPVAIELLKRLDFPLAAPSANPFGSISPTKPEHVIKYFGNNLKMVLNGGVCEKGIESTIVGFKNDEPLLYRLGSISIEDIESVVGKIKLNNYKEGLPIAPGMLLRHYAPNTKTILVDKIDDSVKEFSTMKIGAISFTNTPIDSTIQHKKVLSPKGDLHEAAANLYNTLHEFDKMQLDLIVAERFPNRGIGRSINDRLERATKDRM